MSSDEHYWDNRYQDSNTGWDIGYPSTPLKEYIDQLSDKTLKILIPGAGNAYEAEYLYKQQFKNVYVLDISRQPLDNLKKRFPSFPSLHLLHEDFFEHEGKYNLIFEQTFFCSFDPSEKNRKQYAEKMSSLLYPGGKLVGLWFKHRYNEGDSRPYGGSKQEYLTYLTPYFHVLKFEDSYNSIPPRAGNELFGIFRKKNIDG